MAFDDGVFFLEFFLGVSMVLVVVFPWRLLVLVGLETDPLVDFSFLVYKIYLDLLGVYLIVLVD